MRSAAGGKETQRDRGWRSLPAAAVAVGLLLTSRAGRADRVLAEPEPPPTQSPASRRTAITPASAVGAGSPVVPIDTASPAGPASAVGAVSAASPAVQLSAVSAASSVGPVGPVSPVAPAASASSKPAAGLPARALRWGLGLELSPFTSPAAHTGIPAETLRLPVALSLRRELGRHTALSLGIGGPAAALGLSGWAGLEVYATVASFRGRLDLELYATPGVLLGAAGPDFIARHSDAFPGFAYIYSGPVTLATRLPLGVRLRFFHHRLDAYAEATGTLAFTPAVELLSGLTTGLRVNF